MNINIIMGEGDPWTQVLTKRRKGDYLRGEWGKKKNE